MSEPYVSVSCENIRSQAGSADDSRLSLKVFRHFAVSKRIITPVNGQLATPQKQVYRVEGCCHHNVGYLLLNKSC